MSGARIANIVTRKTENVIAVMEFNGNCHGQTIGSVLTGKDGLIKRLKVTGKLPAS